MGNWAGYTAFDQITSLGSTETSLKISSSDAKIECNPLEAIALMLKFNTSGSTDPFRLRIFCSNKDSPGDVPDSAQGLATSDWSIYQEVQITGTTTWDDVFMNFVLTGFRWFAGAVVRASGSTNTATVDGGYNKDGVTN